MTQWPSVTGTPDEAEFSHNLQRSLADTPYFRDRPEQLMLVASHGNPETSSVVALVRGTGSRTIILAGHFDTVSISNYGVLASLACDPEPLTGALIEELESRARSVSEDKTLADLKSGNFVPGRGLLDMKSGLAAGIAAMESFAGLETPAGNILFVATPDEENGSRGIRSFRNALPDIARRFDLEIIGAINLDASSCEGDGKDGRAIYLGSIGKFLPFAFVVGRPTHAGYPFDGVSAHLIAAEIIRAIDTNSDLRDEAHGEFSPAPVCLEVKDLRDAYDVTTPDKVWLAFNWLTHRRSARDLLGDFRDQVQGALDAALHLQGLNSARAGASHFFPGEARVLTYAELRELVRSCGRLGAEHRIAELEAVAAIDDSPLETTRHIVSAMIAEASIEGPVVIIGFGSLHYPLVHLEHHDAGRDFYKAIRSIVPVIEERHQTTIRDRQIFAGISDMSFLGHRQDAAQARLVVENTPAGVYVDDARDTALRFPVVNIGPWGRDYHQKWERAHGPYTFEVLPELIFEALRAGLAQDGRPVVSPQEDSP
ncbi:M20/M25/M40 family metallo-hydrolase [Rhizobium sp. XQZ8]|nr:M20/M25/M40 family metallo-hydrolase [Rhizobium populisoli]